MSPSERFFGKYQHIVKLSGGGGAEVFLAVVRGPGGFNKLQVIKALRPNLAEDAEFIRMFLEEARLAARLNHPNVVQTNEVFEDGTRYALVMEYLEGQSLYGITRRLAKLEKTIPRSLFLRIYVDMLAGLHYAHEFTDYDGKPLQIVHRDISPQNVFVTYEGQVKVVDFGIAMADSRSVETAMGVIKGKIPYMAPEQVRGSSGTDRRADVFAAGVILFEALTGKRLWGGAADVDILGRLLQGSIPSSPREIDPSIPEALDGICARALASEREDRFPTAAALEEAIVDYIGASGERAEPRDVGQFVSTLFEHERKKIRALIDEQVRLLDSVDPASNEPRVIPRLAALGGESSFSSVHVGEPGSHNTPAPSRMTGARAPMSNSKLGFSAEPLDGPLYVDDDLAMRTRRPNKLILAVAGAAVLVAVGWLTLRSPTPEGGGKAAAAEARSPEAKVSSAKAGEAAVRTTAIDAISVTAEATPVGARLSLDDAPLPVNPFVGKFSKDGLTHRLRADYAGHASKTEVVTFDHNIVVKFALEPERSRAAPSAAKAARPATPPPSPKQPVSSAADPPPPAKRQPTFDRGDPWVN